MARAPNGPDPPSCLRAASSPEARPRRSAREDRFFRRSAHRSCGYPPPSYWQSTDQTDRPEILVLPRDENADDAALDQLPPKPLARRRLDRRAAAFVPSQLQHGAAVLLLRVPFDS